jgi:hypothetical protein
MSCSTLRVLAFAACLAAAAAAQDDADAAFQAQRDAILPTAEERAWRAVPWRPELRLALAEANREPKPVLLWAMNGHPLGQC